MAKSIRVSTKKKRGRPVTTGKGTLIGVRLQSSHLNALDAWIAKRKPAIGRPEAIRALLAEALEIESLGQLTLSLRPQKITFAEMRDMGVRGVTPSMPINGLTILRLSDIEDRFTCTRCGKRGADVRPEAANKTKAPPVGGAVDPSGMRQRKRDLAASGSLSL